MTENFLLLDIGYQDKIRPGLCRLHRILPDVRIAKLAEQPWPKWGQVNEAHEEEALGSLESFTRHQISE